MKRLVFLLALLWVSAARAQTGEQMQTRRFEVELGLGATFGFDRLNFDKNYGGVTVHLEPRYKLRSVPVTVGLQVGLANFKREAVNVQESPLVFNSWNVMAVSDYVWRRDRKFSIFAGVGIGMASLRHAAPISFDNSEPNYKGYSAALDKRTFCVMPRIGLRYGRLRLTCAYMAEEKANNHFRATAGFVFGGGKKKR